MFSLLKSTKHLWSTYPTWRRTRRAEKMVSALQGGCMGLPLILMWTGYTSVGHHATLLESGIASGALSLQAPSLLTHQEWWLQKSQEQHEGAGPSTGVLKVLWSHWLQPVTQPNQSHCGRTQQRVRPQEPLWLFSAHTLRCPPYPFSCLHGEIYMGLSLAQQQLPKPVRHGKY